jgi:hypothetical protein
VAAKPDDHEDIGAWMKRRNTDVRAKRQAKSAFMAPHDRLGGDETQA